MSGIRERLISLDPLQASHPASKQKSSSHGRADQQLGGDRLITPFGECLGRNRTFPLDHHHGLLPLRSLLERGRDGPAFLTGDPGLQEIDLRKALFLDIETTGLAGGTGTYAFLVGLGWYEGEMLRVTQIFMRDYHEEQALLYELSRMAAPFCTVVSYNGKRFDVPFLHTRFVYSRMENPFQDLPHLDLLHPTRRLWRLRLADCTLGTVESEILGFARENDVPGWMIPSIYFEYLQTGNMTGIESVFHHNLLDILSLVVLASRLCQAVEDPFASVSGDGLDLYSLGRLFGHRGHLEQSIDCLRASLKHRVPRQYQQDAMRQLSFAYKRTGRWDKASEMWQKVIEHSPDFQLYPYEELAKYYEHRARDCDRAIMTVERALSAITTIRELRGSGIYDDNEAALRHRLARLKRKQGEA